MRSKRSNLLLPLELPFDLMVRCYQQRAKVLGLVTIVPLSICLITVMATYFPGILVFLAALGIIAVIRGGTIVGYLRRNKEVETAKEPEPPEASVYERL